MQAYKTQLKTFCFALLVLVSVVGTVTHVASQQLQEGTSRDPLITLLDSTVLISRKITPKEYFYATGFLVERVFRDPRSSVYSTRKTRAKIFLITNKHVLPEEGERTWITLRVNTWREDHSEVREITVEVTDGQGKYRSILRMNKRFDIAAVDITQQVLEQNIEGAWLPYELFATRETLREANITIGDEILVLGYPDAIFDPRNAWPILRRGIISTNPLQGYAFNEKLRERYQLPEQIDGFLIDASIYPGSSGSPVLLKPSAITLSPNGAAVVGLKSRPYLLGIVSDSIPISDLGSNQRMGLGVVISADVIKETIEQFFH